MGFGGSASTAIVKEPIPQSIKALFKPSVDLERLHGLKMGVYGRSKVGKTHFALTGPLPIFAVDTEGSIGLNAQRFDKARQEGIIVSEVIRFADKKSRKIDLVQSLDALIGSIDVLTTVMALAEVPEDKYTEDDKIKIQELKSLYPAYDPTKRGTIVIDSATDVWKWMTIWVEETGKRTAKGDMPRFEWGKANKKYADFMYMLLRSNWHVVLTFRSQAAVSDKGEDLGWYTPRWQKDTEFWLDLNTELLMEGTDRVMKFRGDRFGMIQDDLVNPTWDSLIAHLKSKSGVSIE